MDGLAQAVGSRPGPGTLLPPVKCFLPFTPCNHVSPKDGSPVCVFFFFFAFVWGFLLFFFGQVSICLRE